MGYIHMANRLLFSLLLASSLNAADKMTASQLSALAQSNSPALRDAIAATFNPKDLKAGVAWAGRGPDFFFAIDSAQSPALFVDNAPGPQMRQINGTEIWYAPMQIPQVGRLHSFHYTVGA